MARDKELLAARDAKVREMYEDLRSKKSARGKRTHTAEQAFYIISRKLFITEYTIESIIYGKRRKAEPSPQRAASA